MKCDCCQMLNINGINCHETGCPNARRRYNAESGQWFDVVKCHTRGYEFNPDEGPCCEIEEIEEI